jgi:hypothetical protein
METFREGADIGLHWAGFLPATGFCFATGLLAALATGLAVFAGDGFATGFSFALGFAGDSAFFGKAGFATGFDLTAGFAAAAFVAGLDGVLGVVGVFVLGDLDVAMNLTSLRGCLENRKQVLSPARTAGESDLRGRPPPITAGNGGWGADADAGVD